MNTAAALLQVKQRWQALSARERQWVAAMAVALVVVLVWLLALRPVWRTWHEVPPQAAALELQWLQMQGLAAEARELKGQVPVPTSQAVQALQAATTHLGAHGSLTVTGDRATLSVNGATPEQLRGWLAEARQGARARPIELQLNHDDAGLTGRLVVALPGGGA